MNATSTPAASELSDDGGKSRRRRKDARPSELTSAALDLFVEKGFSATRLDDVAARAGVSKGTLYLYFDSKEALFKAVIEEGIVPTLAAAELRVAGYSGSSVELLRHLLFGWWQEIGATRLAGVPKLIISESRNFPEVAQYYHDKVIVRGRALLRSALQRGIECGEFRRLDVETAIDVIIAPLLMLVIWRFSLCFCGRETDPEAYLETHFNLLVYGLRPEGSTLGVRPEGERAYPPKKAWALAQVPCAKPTRRGVGYAPKGVKHEVIREFHSTPSSALRRFCIYSAACLWQGGASA